MQQSMQKTAVSPPTFPPIGMGPETWGPLFWTTMHIVSLGYAPTTPSAEERAGAAAFYNSLKTMIPCPICREHYAEFLAEEPVESATGSRDALIDWVYRLHNKVNVRLGKPALPFDAYIQNMRALSQSGPFKLPGSAVSTTQILVGTAAILGISAAAYYYYSSKK